MKTLRAKLVVIGPHSVGKTSIVTRYQSNVFIPNPNCTVGASFSEIQVITEGVKVKMQVWDTAGQERFRAMAPMYYRGANGALLMFDLTNSDSLNNLREWSKDLLSIIDPDSLVLVVAGNKCDLVKELSVMEKDGRNFATEIQAQYFETSARYNIGVNQVFEYFGAHLARKLQDEFEGEESERKAVNVSQGERQPQRRACC